MERRRRDRFIAWGVNPPTAANRGRGREFPAIGHSLATVRHDGRRPSVTPGNQSTMTASPEGATDCGCGVSRSHQPLLVCRRFPADEFRACSPKNTLNAKRYNSFGGVEPAAARASHFTISRVHNGVLRLRRPARATRSGCPSSSGAPSRRSSRDRGRRRWAATGPTPVSGDSR